MKVFQFHSFYDPYLKYMSASTNGWRDMTYRNCLKLLLEDRFHAVHILNPVYNTPEQCCFSVSNAVDVQIKWADENGVKSRDLTEILLAQIEAHGAEVIYSLDPVRFGVNFIKRLPGCVKHSICWFAAPGIPSGVDAYDLRVCNFRNFIDGWTRRGLRAAWFSPALDDEMIEYGERIERPVDVTFAGLYSEHHTSRNKLLRLIAKSFPRHNITFALQAPRWKPLANRRLLNRIPLPIRYIPSELRRVSTEPVYGRALYELFGSSKIVINAGIDIAGENRGNMRCFEAMGCGAAMLSDVGVYPPDFRPSHNFFIYNSPEKAIECLSTLLDDSSARMEMGLRGRDFMRRNYSKSAQWENFKGLVSEL